MPKSNRHVPAPRRRWLALAGLLALGGILASSLSAAQAAEEGEPRPYSQQELEELVAPVALYPDDLLAIVLPASTYPLQIVEAARFLAAVEQNPDLEPDPDWDDSIVALLNYPDALALLNEDLDWTWRLGEAVIDQQPELMAAVGRFRERAYAAGNLRSDEHQVVRRSHEVIEITPVERDVVYVPYYEPARVVVYQTVPVYHYYSRPCPVYYYPYPPGHGFSSGFFWGVTTVFNVGWRTRHLYAFPHHHVRHPYYGYRYEGSHWRKRPDHDDRRAFRRDGRDRREQDVIWQPGARHGARPGGAVARDRVAGDAPDVRSGFAAERRRQVAPPDRREGQLSRRWQTSTPEHQDAPRRQGSGAERSDGEARSAAATRSAERRAASRAALPAPRESVGRRPDVRTPEAVALPPAAARRADSPGRPQVVGRGEPPAATQRSARAIRMPTLRSAPESSGRPAERASPPSAAGRSPGTVSSRTVAPPPRTASPSRRAVAPSRSAPPPSRATTPSQGAAPVATPAPSAAPSRPVQREAARNDSATNPTSRPGAARSGTASQRPASRPR